MNNIIDFLKSKNGSYLAADGYCLLYWNKDKWIVKEMKPYKDVEILYEGIDFDSAIKILKGNKNAKRKKDYKVA